MRVLIVNKFFYPRGGDCIVAMQTEELLRHHGHTTGILTSEHPLNGSLPNMSATLSLITFAKNPFGAAARIAGIGRARSVAARMIEEFRPDVVHLHNVHSYLSPIIGEIASRRGIRVVWTLHDYKLICPNYTLLHPDGSLCDRCRARGISRRCLHGSLVQSMAGAAESIIWSRRRLIRMTDAFIAPSQFMAERMAAAGFPQEKLHVVANFVDNLPTLHTGSREGFLYAGRLSREKGVGTLIDAVRKAQAVLTIVGDGPMEEELRKRAGDYAGITFLGRRPHSEVLQLMAASEGVVIPSEWYENNPLSALEALCCGTPVIASDIGGLPELITPGNGTTFCAGNAASLTEVLTASRGRIYDYQSIATASREKYNAARHYDKLLAIYDNRPLFATFV